MNFAPTVRWDIGPLPRWPLVKRRPNIVGGTENGGRSCRPFPHTTSMAGVEDLAVVSKIPNHANGAGNKR